MGKEKIAGRHNFLWSIHGHRNFSDSFLLKKYHASTASIFRAINRKTTAGFTLVELIVTIGIIGILAAALALVVQPQKQLNKAWDATRLSDITKIRTASDLYYDSNNCYPDTIPFGDEWKDDSGTVYMSKVPQDPEHGRDPTRSYLYQYDGSTCSQWHVLYGKLTYSTNKATTTCPLQQMSNCLPPGFANSGYNYCVVSGTADCGYIASTPLSGLPASPPTPTPPGGAPTPTPSSVPSPTPGVSPTPSPNPTPTPTPGVCGGRVCTGLCLFGICFGSTPTPTPPGSNGGSCSKDYLCSNGRCNIVPAGTGTYCTRNCDGQC